LGTGSSGSMPVGATVAKCREEYHDLQGLIAPGGLAAALSRWDDEAGAVRDGLPM